MFRVSREFSFCYGHRLLHYPGKCRHLHGHNAKVALVVETSDLDNRGMVLDFSDIKQLVGQWIDDHLDHRMILHRDDPAVSALRDLGEPMLLMDVNPTAENLALLISQLASDRGVPVTEVQFFETPKCRADCMASAVPADRIAIEHVAAKPLA